MAGNKVELCGVNTAKLPLLKEEEKEELFARIKEGDEEAREQYVLRNHHHHERGRPCSAAHPRQIPRT